MPGGRDHALSVKLELCGDAGHCLNGDVVGKKMRDDQPERIGVAGLGAAAGDVKLDGTSSGVMPCRVTLAVMGLLES